jgi:hypothetical protein
MTPMRIYPVAFRFVAQCLNQLSHHVPTSGNGGHVFLSSALEETLRCLSFAPKEKSLITVKSEAGGPQRWCWRIDVEKIPCSGRESNTVHPSRSQLFSSSVGRTLTVCCPRPISFFIFEHKIFIYVSLHSHWHEKLPLFLFVVNVMYSKPNYCVFQSRCGSFLLGVFLEKKFWMWKVGDCANVYLCVTLLKPDVFTDVESNFCE